MLVTSVICDQLGALRDARLKFRIFPPERWEKWSVYPPTSI